MNLVTLKSPTRIPSNQNQYGINHNPPILMPSLESQDHVTKHGDNPTPFPIYIKADFLDSFRRGTEIEAFLVLNFLGFLPNTT